MSIYIHFLSVAFRFHVPKKGHSLGVWRLNFIHPPPPLWVAAARLLLPIFCWICCITFANEQLLSTFSSKDVFNFAVQLMPSFCVWGREGVVDFIGLTRIPPFALTQSIFLSQVSLDTLKPERFASITRRNGLDAVLSSLDAALAHGYGGRWTFCFSILVGVRHASNFFPSRTKRTDWTV